MPIERVRFDGPRSGDCSVRPVRLTWMMSSGSQLPSIISMRSAMMAWLLFSSAALRSNWVLTTRPGMPDSVPAARPVSLGAVTWAVELRGGVAGEG